MKLVPLALVQGSHRQHPGQLPRVRGKGRRVRSLRKRRVSGGSWACSKPEQGGLQSLTHSGLCPRHQGVSGLGRKARAAGLGWFRCALGVRWSALQGKRHLWGEEEQIVGHRTQFSTLPNFRAPGSGPAQVWGDCSREQELCGPLTEIQRLYSGTPGSPHQHILFQGLLRFSSWDW